jgi:hypothetical protein
MSVINIFASFGLNDNDRKFLNTLPDLSKSWQITKAIDLLNEWLVISDHKSIPHYWISEGLNKPAILIREIKEQIQDNEPFMIKTFGNKIVELIKSL